jgi:hypothetical protein
MSCKQGGIELTKVCMTKLPLEWNSTLHKKITSKHGDGPCCTCDGPMNHFPNNTNCD